MNLWRVAIHEKSGKALGPPEPVTTPSPYTGHLTFSRDGRRIAYVQQLPARNIQKVGFDPFRQTAAGELVALTRGSREMFAPDVSPDGEWLAFTSWGQQEDVFIARTDGSDLRQLTNDAYKDRLPRWSPDGGRIAFYSVRSGRYELAVQHWRTADGVTSGFSVYSLGSRKYERLTDFGSRPRWLKDNRRLLFHHEGKIWLIDSRSRKAREVLSAAPHEIDGRFAISPDNRTIYFGLVHTEADVWLMEFK